MSARGDAARPGEAVGSEVGRPRRGLGRSLSPRPARVDPSSRKPSLSAPGGRRPSASTPSVMTRDIVLVEVRMRRPARRGRADLVRPSLSSPRRDRLGGQHQHLHPGQGGAGDAEHVRRVLLDSRSARSEPLAISSTALLAPHDREVEAGVKRPDPDDAGWRSPWRRRVVQAPRPAIDDVRTRSAFRLPSRPGG